MATTLFPLQYLRQNADPIDVDSVFNTTADRIAYLANGRRYPGQIVADLEDDTVYVLNSAANAWINVSGGIPGGTEGQVQYNSSGNFAGATGLTYCSATNTVGLENIANPTSSINITVGQPVTDSWIAQYGDFGPNERDDYSSAVAYDPSGNVYTIGADGNIGSPFLVKYSSSGTVLWQIDFTELNNYYKTGDAVEVDNIGNVYAGIGFDDAVSNATLVKINSAGTSILWQRDITGLSNIAIVDIGVDALNNVYVLAVDRDGDDKSVVLKYNSSGALQWQRQLGKAASNCYPGGMAVDVAGNVYINTQDSSGTYREPVIVKYDTGGVLQWQTQFNTGVSADISAGQVTVDGAGNIFVTSSGYPTDIVSLIKLNSSGVIQWQNNLNIPEINFDFGSGVGVDTTGNVYNLIANGNLYIQKYDSSGVLLWSNKLSGPDMYTYYYWAAQNLAVGSTTFSVSGYGYPGPGAAEAILASLLLSGAGYGSWGNYVYSAYAVTPTTTPFTAVTASLVDSAGSLVDSAGGLSIGSGSGTNTTVTVTGLNNWNFGANGSFGTPNYTLPGNDGNQNYALATDGAGNVSWRWPLELNACGSFITSPTSLNMAGCNQISMGNGALSCSTGIGNISLGYFSLLSNTTGAANIGIGGSTLQNNTTGCRNVAISNGALQCNSTGSCNIAIGNYAGYRIGGSGNVVLGACAGYSINTGSNNTVIGSLFGTCGLSDTVLVGAGTCERLKVDSSGLYVNGSLIGGASQATPISLGTVYACTDTSSFTALGYCAGSKQLGSGQFKSTTIGVCAGGSACSVSVGYAAGYNSTTAATNISIGERAGYGADTLVCGYHNVAIGALSLFCNNFGRCNIAIGWYAMQSNCTGDSNIAIGFQALSSNLNGYGNTAVGTGSQGGINGYGNTSLGWWSLRQTTSSCFSVGIGWGSFRQAAGTCKNVGLGACSGCLVCTGSNNTIIGSLTGSAGLTCTVLIGAGTCERIKVDNNGLCVNGSLIGGASPATPTSLGTVFGYTTGNGNTSIGCCAGNTTQTGCDNIAIGRNSLITNTAGTSNIALGLNSLCLNTTGAANTAIGTAALRNNTTGVGNIAIGLSALSAGTNNHNIAQGYQSMVSTGTGRCNVAIGNRTLFSNCTGSENVAVGVSALYNTLSSGNTAVGSNALGCISGEYNTGLGFYAGQGISGPWSAACVVAIGPWSLLCNRGNLNIAIGACAGCNITTGVNNTVIGSLPAATSCVCTVLIGAGTCERAKIDNAGLCINGSLLTQGDGLSTTAAGWRITPVNSQSADYPLVAADSGRLIFHPASDANPRTYTIPANGSVAYPVGTTITFANDSSSNITIAITTDTLVLVGSGATGSRTLSQYGVATAVKVESTKWYISGTNLI